MTIFLVDYENVGANGLTGIEKLDESFLVTVFYSKNANSLTFDVYNNINTSGAQVDLIEIVPTTKNSLDFQLVTYLGYLIAKDEKAEYIIVSKDTGFSNVVSFWQKQGINIAQVNNLLRENSSTLEVSIKELIQEDAATVRTVSQIVEKYKTKQGINNALVKSYGNDKGSRIYKMIKSLLSAKKS